ncbi:hypothetical protein U1Q18_051536 [Sarracenia purpurea var. burkii]
MRHRVEAEIVILVFLFGFSRCAIAIPTYPWIPLLRSTLAAVNYDADGDDNDFEEFRYLFIPIPSATNA